MTSNATCASIDLKSWSDNGCAILYFVVQYKEHFLSDWIMLSNNVIPEQARVLLSDLVPATWYDLSMIAHSEAGSSEAQYLFSTLTTSGGQFPPTSLQLTDLVLIDSQARSLLCPPPLIRCGRWPCMIRSSWRPSSAPALS